MKIKLIKPQHAELSLEISTGCSGLGTVTIMTVSLNASSTVHVGNKLSVVGVEGDLSVSSLCKDPCLRLMGTTQPSSGLPGSVGSVCSI